MEYEELTAEEPSASVNAAERLKAAREAKGMTIDQVAAKTRITLRHLELIEAGQFTSLPGRTYAVGFAKNFAETVGENPEEIVEAVRAEFPSMREAMAIDRSADFEPGDPGKIPSTGLTWLSIVAVALLGVGAYTFYTSFYGSGASPGSLIDDAAASIAEATTGDEAGADGATAAAPASGPVVFTAQDDEVWVRFYDGSGNVFLEKIMTNGETWTVPADAVDPQIRTSRPDALAITIGGQAIPKLDDEPLVVSDIGISAEALLARVEEQSAEEAAETAETTAEIS